MKTDRPLLKIYADEQASHRALIGMERTAKISSFIALVLAVTLLYLIVNEIEDFRFLTVLFCLLSAGTSWLFYKSIPSYLKEYQELPLLYSFYPRGFISHRGEQEYSWEQISTIQYSKTSINLKMMRNPHKTAELAFGSISDASINRILRHLKTHAPERLSKKITF